MATAMMIIAAAVAAAATEVQRGISLSVSDNREGEHKREDSNNNNKNTAKTKKRFSAPTADFSVSKKISSFFCTQTRTLSSYLWNDHKSTDRCNSGRKIAMCFALFCSIALFEPSPSSAVTLSKLNSRQHRPPTHWSPYIPC